jgi:predicted Fe-S protein YdhL (DUF1289 family)
VCVCLDFFAQHREKEAQLICAELMALAKVSPCESVCASVRATIVPCLGTTRCGLTCAEYAAARAARQHLVIRHQDRIHGPAAAPPCLQSLSALGAGLDDPSGVWPGGLDQAFGQAWCWIKMGTYNFLSAITSADTGALQIRNRI